MSPGCRAPRQLFARLVSDWDPQRPPDLASTWSTDFPVWLSLQGADDAVPSEAQMTVPLEPWDLRADYSGGVAGEPTRGAVA